MALGQAALAATSQLQRTRHPARASVPRYFCVLANSADCSLTTFSTSSV
jgi:hypothetical protein